MGVQKNDLVVTWWTRLDADGVVVVLVEPYSIGLDCTTKHMLIVGK